jgi:DNA invertase Pin-like site-specific DNA recombinase
MLRKRNHREHDHDRPRRKQAVIYLRGLGDGEADLINVPSIDTQRQICHHEAKDLHAEVVGEFVDTAGASPPLPGFGRLVDRLDNGPRVDYLVVYSLDRLVPEREGAFITGWLLGSAGTILVSWAHAYDSAPEAEVAD